jgi:hypothetical protein
MSASEDVLLEPVACQPQRQLNYPEADNALYNPCWDPTLTPTIGEPRHRAFVSLLEQYIKRQLSYDTDSLLALFPLLQRLERQLFSEGFLYGLPRTRFRESLLWHSGGEQRQQNPGVPSWTWAAWKLPGYLAMYDSTHYYSRPPLTLHHDGQILEPDLDSEPQYTNTESPNLIDTIWAGVKRGAVDVDVNATPPTPGALLVDGLILTI